MFKKVFFGVKLVSYYWYYAICGGKSDVSSRVAKTTAISLSLVMVSAATRVIPPPHSILDNSIVF